MFKRAYIEITNICNLNCNFCIGTKRIKKFMSVDEFTEVAEKIHPFTDYIYLHILGEPLLHPELDEILSISEGYGFTVNITTNGTLLREKKTVLQKHKCIRKISVSLHSFEANNNNFSLENYLSPIFDFCKSANCIVDLRLWNEGGDNLINSDIIDFLSEKTGVDIYNIVPNNGSRKLGEKLYLSSAEKFEWPSLTANEKNTKHCYGLKTQFGVLCDGTVVPCCLDSEGSINLGNIFHDDLEEILFSPRANKLVDGFNNGKPSEELCRRCGFAERF